jgi:hypothetical protein
MRVEHRDTIHARCPRGGWDYYEVVVVPDGFLAVEDFTAALDAVRGCEEYQEVIAERLAERLGCSVRLLGRHGRVTTEVVAA